MLEIFKFYDVFDIIVKSKDVEIMKFGDHIYNIVSIPQKIYPIAKEFNLLMKENEERRE